MRKKYITSTETIKGVAASLSFFSEIQNICLKTNLRIGLD